MNTPNPSSAALAGAPNNVELRQEAWGDVRDSYEKFRLTCGIKVLQEMVEWDVDERGVSVTSASRQARLSRWGSVVSEVDFHDEKAALDRPRVRDKNAGKEIQLTSWEHFLSCDVLREWAVT